MFRLLCLVIGVGALLLASSGQCKPTSHTAEEVQEKLHNALSLMQPHSSVVVNEFMKFVDATPRYEPDTFDYDLDYYKRVVIAYRDSKGQEATKTVEQRTKIIDDLISACQDAENRLLEFDLIVKIIKKQEGAEALNGLPQVDKWAATYKACNNVALSMVPNYPGNYYPLCGVEYPARDRKFIRKF